MDFSEDSLSQTPTPRNHFSSTVSADSADALPKATGINNHGSSNSDNFMRNSNDGGNDNNESNSNNVSNETTAAAMHYHIPGDSDARNTTTIYPSQTFPQCSPPQLVFPLPSSTFNVPPTSPAVGIDDWFSMITAPTKLTEYQSMDPQDPQRIQQQQLLQQQQIERQVQYQLQQHFGHDGYHLQHRRWQVEPQEYAGPSSPTEMQKEPSPPNDQLDSLDLSQKTSEDGVLPAGFLTEAGNRAQMAVLMRDLNDVSL
jgi:hypothetical protein